MSINRPLKPALLRGWRRCCPSCGKGALLYKYLKVHDSCDACGQELLIIALMTGRPILRY